MAIGLIGRKLGMTRIFREDGVVTPVTIVEVGPCPVVQVKTPASHGYAALQLGFGDVKKSKLIKPLAGQFGENMAAKRYLKEFRLADGEEASYQAGQVLRADFFQVGQKVDVRGNTKGRGHAGVIKRHNFHGGPGGHGSNFHRIPGSIGNNSDPHKVFKGRKMSGRYGNTQVCVQNLEVIAINADEHTMAIRGALPGSINSLVYVTSAAKTIRKKVKK